MAPIRTYTDCIYTAIEQEEKLNQDEENALGDLTSNIGKIIQEIMNDEV